MLARAVIPSGANRGVKALGEQVEKLAAEALDRPAARLVLRVPNAVREIVGHALRAPAIRQVCDFNALVSHFDSPPCELVTAGKADPASESIRGRGGAA